MQVTNSTPDETAFHRLALLREPVPAAMTMIQPTLFTYSFQGPAEPTVLDASALKNDQILLLDTWFMVVIHYGHQIATVTFARLADLPA